MAFLAAAVPYLGALGSAFGVAGSLQSGKASMRAARRTKLAKEAEARELDYQAGQVQAVAQREGIEESKRAELIASRALAVSAASGAGASDPTVVNLIADINNEGAYRAAVALYNGEQQARKIRMGATAARDEAELAMESGKEKKRAYDLQAAGQAVQGVSSLYTKYGQNTPASGTSFSGSGTSSDPFVASDSAYKRSLQRSYRGID